MAKSFVEMLHERPMTLIMSLPANDPELARIAWEQGADVVKVHMNVEHRASKTVFGSFEQEKENLQQIIEEAKGPCGIVAGGDLFSATRDYPAAVNAGFSVISLYSRHMSPQILQCPNITKMVALDNHFTVEEVKSLEKIGGNVLEASIMDPETYGQRLSAKELLQYACICSNTGLPVVVPSQRVITPNELPSLQQCGVTGIMIGAVVTGKNALSIAHSVSEFRKQINTML